MIRCPGCRTRRATYMGMFTHLLLTGHKVCNCGGYDYAHRPGSPYCYRNAMSDVRHAARRGDDWLTLMEIAAECAWERPGVKVRRGEAPPF